MRLVKTNELAVRTPRGSQNVTCDRVKVSTITAKLIKLTLELNSKSVQYSKSQDDFMFTSSGNSLVRRH